MQHTILCVDDESDNVDALERLFRRKYRVLKATSGDAALKILAENQVTVIISDQRMPQMQGVELLSKSIAIHPNAIRILLTGYTDIDSVIAAINAGQIYRYVTKPWDPVDLTNAVDKAVERYEIGQELVEKNQALALALEELQTLDQAKNSFMVLVNHELKTPLTSLLSFSDLLAETNLSDDQNLYLSRIRSSAARLQTMINDVLEFVLAETAQMKMDRQPLSAEKFFTEIPLPIAKLAESRQVSFAFHLVPAKVSLDERAMRNVWHRLLHNAAKFADIGSTVEVRGSTSTDGKYLLQLRNRALPIEEAKIRQIFKPFTLNENIMHHSTGTGLGLSICQSILKLHHSPLELMCKDGFVEVAFTLEAQ